jgi:hypothetical protein
VTGKRIPVAIRSSTMPSAVARSNTPVLKLLKLDLLEPSTHGCAPEQRVIRNAPGQFCRYLGQENGFIVGNGCLQFARASGAGEMTQYGCIKNETSHTLLSNSPRSSSSDMASGSGRSASSTEWWSSSTVLAAVSCPLRYALTTARA